MQWFSERKKFKQVSNVIQTDSMSAELRNSLWNVLDSEIWSEPTFMRRTPYEPAGIELFSKYLWSKYFKKPVDERETLLKFIFRDIRHFFFKCEWFEVYDFLQFVVIYYDSDEKLVKSLNSVLERELSGFRIVGCNITDITDKQEVDMLEDALQDTTFKGASIHLRTALELLSKRDNPDYRNSIKESISAVESIARVITGKPSATLGQALKILGGKNKIHPALEKGFLNLYGYTSDEGGIRHAIMREANITAADAKYFLLSCTSFVNYLKSLI